MTKYMTFIQNDRKTYPIGIIHSEAEAIGTLIREMSQIFIDDAPNDYTGDCRITFDAPDYVDPDDPLAGKKITGGCITSEYHSLTGYALAVEEEE